MAQEVGTDRELEVMSVTLKAIMSLDDEEARDRVLNYLKDRVRGSAGKAGKSRAAGGAQS